MRTAARPPAADAAAESIPAEQVAGLGVLLARVAATGYQFVPPTPLTHQRVLANCGRGSGATLRDIFGWNLPFATDAVGPALLEAMASAGALLPCREQWRSAVRIASIDDALFLHSPFPTLQNDAVFFGPDTYRFARFIRQALASRAAPDAATFAGSVPLHARPLRLLDVGCGSGAGGIVAAALLTLAGPPVELVCNDINPLALAYAGINATHAGRPVTLAAGDALSSVFGLFDLIISNPPYLDDPAQRAYRHGGGHLGSGLSLRIATEAMSRLAPGGSLLLYTGVAVVDGQDAFRAALLPLLEAAGCDWSYEEIDPDVFGEELDEPAYVHADRIAAVGLIATRRRAIG
ncbi:MAG: methyltransferase [Herminiimonas sp.]|nr:methyltransferase [Herminiimonas sp.]